ncbi:MAG: HAD family hydrolase [bacterium]|nr:HAD family hydrolase [bacterium]
MLVVFDCDGVLVDSEPLANREFTRALNEIGLEIEFDEVCREFIGRSMSSCVETVERRLGRPVPQEFLAQLERATFEAFRRDLRPVPGVRGVVENLDTPYCVASSGPTRKIRLTLGLTGLLPLFEGRIFSAADVGRGKPWPDLFLHAAERMGVTPGDCVVVEDSLPGVQAAVAAGMTVLAYAPRGDASGLAEAGATLFDTMRRLPALISRDGRPAGGG